jgi:hypothetical protein
MGSNANLTPIYIQPTAPQVPQVFSSDDLKQVKYFTKYFINCINYYPFIDSRYVSKYG